MDNLDVSALCAELRKKEEDLLQAARYGKDLLEERGQLRSDLEARRKEYESLHELMQSQKAESQRMLAAVRNTAEAQISDQSEQLQILNQTLTRERLQADSMREEHKKMAEQFQIENKQLRAELQMALQSKEKAVLLHSELSSSLQTLEEEKWKLNLEIVELQKQIQGLTDNNKGLSQDVSILTHTCDKISDDLENSLKECEYWENQYVTANEALQSQKKDLLDSQELVKQLQLQLDQQSMMNLTPDSGISLFEELSSANHTVMPEELSSAYDSCEDLLESCRRESGIQSNSMDCVTVAPEERLSPQTGWTDDFKCQRCQQLEEELLKHRKEFKCINEQLMTVVQQKFELQQQIEAWQSDMAQVVDKQVVKQLKKDQPRYTLPSPKDCKLCERRSNSKSWFFGSFRTDA